MKAEKASPLVLRVCAAVCCRLHIARGALKMGVSSRVVNSVALFLEGPKAAVTRSSKGVPRRRYDRFIDLYALPVDSCIFRL